MIVIFIHCAMGVLGNGGIATLSLVLYFESCISLTIFTLAIRGLGRHIKLRGVLYRELRPYWSRPPTSPGRARQREGYAARDVNPIDWVCGSLELSFVPELV